MSESTTERDSVKERLERAEAAFGRGEVPVAERLLLECAEDESATPVERAEAFSDLAVLAARQGPPRDGRRLLLQALAAHAEHVPALENLATMCAENGDLVEATHWRRRAAEAAPGDAQAWDRLGTTLRARRRYPEARSAFERAANAGLDARAEVPFASGVPAAAPTGEPRPLGRVLIVTDYFFPSAGGTERLAEATALSLQTQGAAVEFATRHLDERTIFEHRGMAIHEVTGDVVSSMHAIVERGRYDSILTFAHPMCWPLHATLRMPRPRPRIIVVPCVNAENYSDLHTHPQLMADHALLMSQADVVCHSSLSGYDVRLCEELSVPSVYMPNAVERVAASEFPIAEPAAGEPLLLVVGNMWPQKNHPALLQALSDHPGTWRLAILGDVSPQAPEVADEVRRLAAADDRVHVLGPAGPEAVAAAMEQATVLLLPSLAEATPLVLLEAMSHRLPWIATPTSGSAHDHAGGLILPLERFGEGIDFLLGDPDAATRLGDAGLGHWEQCYTWEILGPRYARLLTGDPVAELDPPAEALIETEAIRAAFYDGLVGP